MNISYPPRMFKSASPSPYKSFEDTPFTLVSAPEQLSEMIEKLKSSREIAVDLEYHSYRTFAGFVCLMQISSREEDWIVDTLELREELEDLNEIFADPNIVKVRTHTLYSPPIFSHISCRFFMALKVT